ncbi:hypothetical protein POM88_001491 [Heracleum sosnowskyi]|uniref:BED-type domain-containing protein n=1 Tax=Heracleum sosnowskyi TaxID=360622 RepID=A0AAD8JDT3_9APIA|nr:hypothetical protein POM88_001491 [Heracleum sosnowskyi]
MSSQSLHNPPSGADENSQPSSMELQQSYIVGGRERSDVWNHSDKVKIGAIVKVVCKYCKKPMKGDSGSGTTHFRNHFLKKHSKPQESIRQKLLASNFNKDHPELAAYNFNYEAGKQELSKMIIMHEYHICIVEHIGFKRNSARLQPLFKVPK